MKNTKPTNVDTEFEKFWEEKGKTEITEIRIASTDKNYAKAEQVLLENLVDSQNRKDWTAKDWEENLRQASQLLTDIANAMKSKLEPNSETIQTLLQQHYNHSKTFYRMSPRVYVAMAELYRQHPDFRLQLESVDPMLPEFMAEAMVYFSNNE